MRGGVFGTGKGEFGDDDEDVGEARPFHEGEVAVLDWGDGEKAVEVGFSGFETGEEDVKLAVVG